MTQPPYGYGPGYAPGYGPGYGYGLPPYVPPPPKPGCVPLRPLGLGDILDGSFKMIRRNPRVTIGLSAAVAVVQVLLVAVFEVVSYALLGKVNVTSSSDPTAETNLGPLLGSNAVQFASFVVSSLLGAVLTGMLTVAITQDVLGVRMTIAEVWARVRKRIWPLIGLAVLTTVVEFAGLLACVAPGVWLWGIWAVAVPALMVEGTTIRGALGRSRQLVAGTFWRVWGIRALGTMIASFIGSFIAMPFLLVGVFADSSVLSSTDGNAVPILFIVLTAVGSAVSATFTAPLRAGIDALLYVDLRMRKEGLDIVLQQAAAKTGPYARPTAPPLPHTAF